MQRMEESCYSKTVRISPNCWKTPFHRNRNKKKKKRNPHTPMDTLYSKIPNIKRRIFFFCYLGSLLQHLGSLLWHVGFSCGTGALEYMDSVVALCRLHQLQHTDAVVVLYWLHCPVACGILFPWPETEQCPMHWKVDS